MDDDQIEHTLLINRSVQVFRIPPRPAAGGHRSGEWQVADQIFSGRLRVVARGEQVDIRVEDASTGELFASCPCTPATQAVAVEPAADSSRYFVLRVEDAVTRRHAFLGLGFSERGEAFDFNAALADHAKQCQRESMLYQQQQQQQHRAPAAAAAADAYSKLDDPQPQQLFSHPGDLSFKEGQTIKIDIHHRPAKPGGFLSRSSGGGAAAAGSSSSGAGLLPPPVLPPPPMGASSGMLFPPAAAISTAAAPAAVTVADNQENWAQF